MANDSTPTTPEAPPLPPPPPPPPPPAVDVTALLDKARSDEKSKVRSQIESAQRKADEEKQRADRLQAELEATQAKLSRPDADRLELENVRRAAAEAQRAADEAKAEAKATREVAARELNEMELRHYRDKKIAEGSVELVELVSGTTKEEIDASVARAVARQQALTKKAREDLRLEMSAQVPSPTAPPASGPSGALGSLSRRQITRLPDSEFQKYRAQLLEERKRQAGLS